LRLLSHRRDGQLRPRAHRLPRRAPGHRQRRPKSISCGSAETLDRSAAVPRRGSAARPLAIVSVRGRALVKVASSATVVGKDCGG